MATLLQIKKTEEFFFVNSEKPFNLPFSPSLPKFDRNLSIKWRHLSMYVMEHEKI